MKNRWAGCLAIVLGCLTAAHSAAEEPPVPAAADATDSCPDRTYARAEYLLWWIKDANLPPLVATGPLGTPGSVVLFGGEGLSTDTHSGGRFTLGYWLTAQHDFAVEGAYFFLAEENRPFTAGGTGSPGSPTLVRPFFNLDTQREDAVIVASPPPGAHSGNIALTLSDRLQGAELNLRSIGWSSPEYQVDLLAGGRFLALDEGLDVSENSLTLATGTATSVAEAFTTRNRFYGGQTGVVGRWHLGNWLLDARGVVALGVMEETVEVGGLTVTTGAGATTLTRQGLLAQADNLGRHSHSAFAVVPEVGLNVGRQLTTHLAGYVGYTFLYASSVAQPGEAIDRAASLTPAGGSRPAFTVHDTDFWAQGIDFGLELRF